MPSLWGFMADMIHVAEKRGVVPTSIVLAGLVPAIHGFDKRLEIHGLVRRPGTTN
jgi:hypothetical protein